MLARQCVLGIAIAAASCGEEGVVLKPVQADLGPFQSDVLKISWFHYELLVGTPEGEKRISVIGWQPRWSAIFSYGWLRQRGYRPGEGYLRNLRGLKTSFSREGFPDEEVRQMVAQLLVHGHLTEIPAVQASYLTPEWFRRLETLPVNEESWENQVKLARVLVVESDKTCRIMVHSAIGPDPKLAAKSLALHNEAERLMAKFAPEAGQVRIEKQ